MVVVCVRAWCQFCHSRHWDWLWLYAWWLNVSMITSWLFFSRFDKSIFVRWFFALRRNKESVHIDSNTCEWVRILHCIRASLPVNNDSNDSKRVEPIKMKWKFSGRCCYIFEPWLVPVLCMCSRCQANLNSTVGIINSCELITFLICSK